MLGNVLCYISRVLFVQEFHDFGVDITIGFTELFLGITNLLIYCYLGKLANESYAQMPDCMFYMNWYELPSEIQKYFILMIGNMQRALYYRGFGIIVLNLETFTRVSERIQFRQFPTSMIFDAPKLN